MTYNVLIGTLSLHSSATTARISPDLPNHAVHLLLSCLYYGAWKITPNISFSACISKYVSKCRFIERDFVTSLNVLQYTVYNTHCHFLHHCLGCTLHSCFNRTLLFCSCTLVDAFTVSKQFWKSILIASNMYELMQKKRYGFVDALILRDS